MSNDLEFIASIRKQGRHAEDNLAMCDVLHLIKMVADGDLIHVDEPQHARLRDMAEEVIEHKPHTRRDDEGVEWMEAEMFEAFQVDFAAALKGKTYKEFMEEKAEQMEGAA